jgi:hypothetical protein
MNGMDAGMFPEDRRCLGQGVVLHVYVSGPL